MPPSQLKRLKASLREQGLVSPQQSKKQRQGAKNHRSKESGELRAAKLDIVREQSNPFNFKIANVPKFAVAGKHDRQKAGTSRPGVAKSLGEEKRRNTLFLEMQRRKKTGGINDRRFGENDPQMTPEQRSLHRFVRERERASQKQSIYDLEDPVEDSLLTHLGRSLPRDDLEDSSPQQQHSANDATRGILGRGVKRKRLSSPESDSSQEEAFSHDENSERKSRKEVMEEVIARSKLQKYERQKEKEDDDDLRAELDKGLSEIFSALRGNHHGDATSTHKPSLTAAAPVNPDRQALIEGKDRAQADKEYDARLRQMVIDQRAEPAMPTLTEEEKIQRQALKVKEHEEERLRRMRGNVDGPMNGSDGPEHVEIDAIAANDEADGHLGLGEGIPAGNRRYDFDVEDEDQFLIDDDIMTDGSGSEIALNEVINEADASDADTDKYMDGMGLEEDEPQKLTYIDQATPTDGTRTLSPSFERCPGSLMDFLGMVEYIDVHDIPLVVQKLRAVFHPKLRSENKAKLAILSSVLVDFVYYSCLESDRFDARMVEQIIRHVHSLGKMFSTEIGTAFRLRLRDIERTRAQNLNTGDLMILMAINSVFPTSDHFHPVVTPAMLCMTRYLSHSNPKNLHDVATGTFVCGVCLQYQVLAKRFIPEVLNYQCQIVSAFLPTTGEAVRSQIPCRALPGSLELNVATQIGRPDLEPIPLSFSKILLLHEPGTESEAMKSTLLTAQLRLIDVLIDLYEPASSFAEILTPCSRLLHILRSATKIGVTDMELQRKAEDLSAKLERHIKQSLDLRKPLAVHHHRSLPIKTSLPKFDESFNPDKHNDPDENRAELSKLKAQHKKERKGALRELRKDSRFMAREELREKKERDAAYDKKFKRLVAEIQGEEGHESKMYEKEKRKRLGKR